MDLHLANNTALVTGSTVSIKRFATTDEVAFICSPRASAIKGSAIRVKGESLRSAF